MNSPLDHIVTRFAAGTDAAFADGRSCEHLQNLMVEVGVYVADAIHTQAGPISKGPLRNFVARVSARAVSRIVIELYEEGGVTGEVLHQAEEAAIHAFFARFDLLQALAHYEGGAHA